LPERHLGLVTAAEGGLTPDHRRALAAVVEAHVDVAGLLALARPPAGARGAGAARAPVVTGRPPVRIGVARDAAFQFYYPENLDRLRAAGADLVPWSPLVDPVPDVDGLYFGGGYPELHAGPLAANTGVLERVGRMAAAGLPIYAECGGLMYLAEAIEDLDGVAHPMVGLLPTTVRMRGSRLTLGYTEARFALDTPLGPAGGRARGHEFHLSSMDPVPARVTRAWRLTAPGGAPRDEGYLVGRALLTYAHLHFGSNPALAPAFVTACSAAAVR
jgi:cobyrinic acid a,c-diamide synthase